MCQKGYRSQDLCLSSTLSIFSVIFSRVQCRWTHVGGGSSNGCSRAHKGNAKYYTHNEAGTIWYNFNVMCWYKKFRFFWSTILIVLKLGSLAPNNMSEERKNGGEKPWQKGAREWHDQESCWMLIQGHTTIYHISSSPFHPYIPTVKFALMVMEYNGAHITHSIPTTSTLPTYILCRRHQVFEPH